MFDSLRSTRKRDGQNVVYIVVVFPVDAILVFRLEVTFVMISDDFKRNVGFQTVVANRFSEFVRCHVLTFLSCGSIALERDVLRLLMRR